MKLFLWVMTVAALFYVLGFQTLLFHIVIHIAIGYVCYPVVKMLEQASK